MMFYFSSFSPTNKTEINMEEPEEISKDRFEVFSFCFYPIRTEFKKERRDIQKPLLNF